MPVHAAEHAGSHGAELFTYDVGFTRGMFSHPLKATIATLGLKPSRCHWRNLTSKHK
jgi:hypothetical protein